MTTVCQIEGQEAHSSLGYRARNVFGLCQTDEFLLVIFAMNLSLADFGTCCNSERLLSVHLRDLLGTKIENESG